MISNSSANEMVDRNPENKDNIERVYVDWPDTDNEEFRFISSRMEDTESDLTPLVFLQDKQNIHYNNFDINQLKFTDTPSKRNIPNTRYEDLTKKKTSKKIKNSSVPPLDLISQNSSIEIPGSKGIIDIDLRSSSDSLSDSSQESNDKPLENFERDSLNAAQTTSYYQNHEPTTHTLYSPLLNTTLPDVKRSDLVLNPGEYDSSRYNQPNPNVMRKFSEISVSSQYRTESFKNEQTSNRPINSHDQRIENEKAAFEAAKVKYKTANRNSGYNHSDTQKTEFGSPAPKNVKSKPTLLVAPQIKQPLYNANSSEKTINFVELNKSTTNAPKQVNQSSYTSKFIDRHKKDSPKSVLKKSASCKDSLHIQAGGEEKSFSDQNYNYSSDEYLHKRDRPVERLVNDNSKGEYRDLPYLNNNVPINYNAIDPSKVINQSHVFYAFNQYGEPIIINTDNVIIANNNPKLINPQFNSSQYSHHSDYFPPPNLTRDVPSKSNSPSTTQKFFPFNQDVRRSSESDFILKDAAFKRQPTLYDENLLTKKLKEVSGSRFPPIPQSSDSSISQSNNLGYAANHRRKENNYEQYTLRDFKNIKQIDRVGGLGPNLGSESHRQMKEKFIRQKNYGKAVQDKNRQEFTKKNDRISRDKSSASEDFVENISPTNEPDFDYKDKSFPMEESSQDHFNEQQNNNQKEENKSNTNQKSMSTSAKDQANKRDAMLNYAKSIQEKQIKKRDSKPQVSKSQSATSNKEADKRVIHQLIDNSELEKLLQRHENDKKIADQIRQKLGKIS